MGKLATSAVGALFAGLLAGCGTLPRLPDAERLRIADIVNRVQCETQLGVAAIRQDQPLNWELIRGWTAAFTLKLIVEDTVQVSPTSVLTGLPVHLGTLTNSAALSAGGTNRRTVNVNFGFRIRDLDEFECRSTYIDGHPLHSELGIPEWLTRSLAPFDNSVTIAQPTLVGSTLDFIVDTSGRITPGITLRLAPGGTNAVGSLFSGQRKDTHTLEIAFKPVV